MSFRRYPGNADIVNIAQPHVEVFGDIVIGTTRNETEFVIFIIDCYGVIIKGIICLTYKIQLCSDLQMLESLTALSVAEASDVKIVQMDFLNRLVFFCSHNCVTLWFLGQK